MSNRFNYLDTMFPVGQARRFGEVVSIGLRARVEDQEIGVLRWKRKAVYVNASVNAWHMHRGLCADFVELIEHNGLGMLFPRSVLRDAKRVLGDIVDSAYQRNFYSNGERQYTDAWLKIVGFPRSSNRGLDVVELTHVIQFIWDNDSALDGRKRYAEVGAPRKNLGLSGAA